MAKITLLQENTLWEWNYSSAKIAKINTHLKVQSLMCQLADNNPKVGDTCSSVDPQWDSSPDLKTVDTELFSCLYIQVKSTKVICENLNP